MQPSRSNTFATATLALIAAAAGYGQALRPIEAFDR
jgi:hypothetical protein